MSESKQVENVDCKWDENDLAVPDFCFTKTENEPQSKHFEILQLLFGHKKFRPMQWKIIDSILNQKRDNCAIMSTGYGKSLCFQFPSAFTGGVTFVVSPLISLMEDQILGLTVANIPACLLGSANTNQAKTVKEISENKYRLIYLTPEFCDGDYGTELLSQWYGSLPIDLIAIDEAHCVSSWGHDFRIHYRNLGKLRDKMPNVPILAVTATATKLVRDDIVKSLKLRNPQLISTSFDRPNFYFAIYKKTDNQLDDLKKTMKNGRFSGPTIIYCITRKETEDLALLLTVKGIKCAVYHAGLSLKTRKENHENFVKDKVGVIVATVAFGMGIDKPDIRNVIHYGVSDSIENYYQEVGRAGRDGEPANCICFYKNSDFTKRSYMRQNSFASDKYRKNQENMAEYVRSYLETTDCRRKFILSYFEEKIDTSNRNTCCDNCFKKKSLPNSSEIYEGLDNDGNCDISTDARLLLSVVYLFKRKYGLGTYVDFVRGSKLSKFKNYFDNSLHGSGKNKSIIWWKELGYLLIKKNFLSKLGVSNNKFVTLLEITEAGKIFLTNTEEKLVVSPTQTMLECLKVKSNIWSKNDEIPSTSKSDVNIEEVLQTNMEVNRLLRLLVEKRLEIASKENCMPYMVASNKALINMAKLMPQSLKELEAMRIDGFTAAKIEKFGKQFLTTFPYSTPKSIQELLLTNPLPEKCTINASANSSYALYETGKSLKEISEARGMAVSTIENHLSACLKVGKEVKLSVFGVNRNLGETIIKEIVGANDGFNLINPIKFACPDYVTYGQIRSLLAYIQIREHLEQNSLRYHEFDDPEYYGIYKRLKEQAQQEQIRNNKFDEFLMDISETPKDEVKINKLDELLEGLEDVEKNGLRVEEIEKTASCSGILDASFDDILDDIGEPLLKKSKMDYSNLLGIEDVEKTGVCIEESEITTSYDKLVLNTFDDLGTSFDKIIDNNKEPILKQTKMDFSNLLGIEDVEKNGVCIEESEITTSYDKLVLNTFDDLGTSFDKIIDNNKEPILKQTKMDFSNLLGIEDVEKNGVCIEESENTTSSDRLLLNISNILETNVDDILDNNGETLSKKNGMDFSNLLDSPPRTIQKNDSDAFNDESADTKEDPTVRKEETVVNVKEVETKKVDTLKNTNVKLPPWLIKKRVA